MAGSRNWKKRRKGLRRIFTKFFQLKASIFIGRGKQLAALQVKFAGLQEYDEQRTWRAAWNRKTRYWFLEGTQKIILANITCTTCLVLSIYYNSISSICALIIAFITADLCYTCTTQQLYCDAVGRALGSHLHVVALIVHFPCIHKLLDISCIFPCFSMIIISIWVTAHTYKLYLWSGDCLILLGVLLLDG